MYTGHVTAGGSICLEALTQSGTAGSWKPDFSVESLMNVIVINMVRDDNAAEAIAVADAATATAMQTCALAHHMLSLRLLSHPQSLTP